MRGFRIPDLFSSKNGVKTTLLKYHKNCLGEEMAMHFDKMFIECLDSKCSLSSKELEVKQLKELVLLHLDLIEQQAQEILSKDLIIKGLNSENETVSISLLPSLMNSRRLIHYVLISSIISEDMLYLKPHFFMFNSICNHFFTMTTWQFIVSLNTLLSITL